MNMQVTTLDKANIQVINPESIIASLQTKYNTLLGEIFRYYPALINTYEKQRTLQEPTSVDLQEVLEAPRIKSNEPIDIPKPKEYHPRPTLPKHEPETKVGETPIYPMMNIYGHTGLNQSAKVPAYLVPILSVNPYVPNGRFLKHIAQKALYVKKNVVRDSLVSPMDQEHRMEHWRTVRGVQYINDSKATNVNAARFALEETPGSIIWIAGGVDRSNDYTILKPLVQEKVKLIICLGADNRKIHQAFSGTVDIILNTHSMADAVHLAARMGEKGDTVLLSPACSSFDLFDNYEDRGRQFKNCVANLP